MALELIEGKRRKSKLRNWDEKKAIGEVKAHLGRSDATFDNLGAEIELSYLLKEQKHDEFVEKVDELSDRLDPAVWAKLPTLFKNDNAEAILDLLESRLAGYTETLKETVPENFDPISSDLILDFTTNSKRIEYLKMFSCWLTNAHEKNKVKKGDIKGYLQYLKTLFVFSTLFFFSFHAYVYLWEDHQTEFNFAYNLFFVVFQFGYFLFEDYSDTFDGDLQRTSSMIFYSFQVLYHIYIGELPPKFLSS